MRETETGTQPLTEFYEQRISLDRSCNICLDDTQPGVERCASCQSWMDYWQGLTPEQQAEEIHTMDQYGSDPNGGST